MQISEIKEKLERNKTFISMSRKETEDTVIKKILSMLVKAKDTTVTESC